MLSEALIASICDDVGAIYRLSCDKNAEDTMASEVFKTTAEKIRQEQPVASDAEIFKLILRIYSEVIRHQ